MARLGCFMLKSGFFSKSLVLCLRERSKISYFVRMKTIEGYSPLLSYVRDYTSTYQQNGLKFKLSSDCVHRLNSFLPAVARFVFRLLSGENISAGSFL